MAALNIVPLCRSHHTEYDGGRLELLPYLSKAEQAHCVGLVGAAELVQRTTVGLRPDLGRCCDRFAAEGTCEHEGAA